MARYFLRFRNADVGLTPSFLDFKKASDLSDVGSPPAIVELVSATTGGGTYYFDYVPTFDIVYEVDGGAGIADATVRFIAGKISPNDTYIDEPVSQVKTDIWSDNTVYAGGQKGKRVDDIGAAADGSGVASLFGKALLYRNDVFNRVGAPAGASIAADLAAIKAETATINTATSPIAALLTRGLGLMHENSVIDSTVFDGSNNLTAARMRIYNSRANALLAGAGGLVATYTITASYVGSNISTYTVVLEP